MIINLNMKPPRTTAQEKGARVVNGRIMFYTKAKVKEALNEYKEKLAPYKLKKPIEGEVSVYITYTYYDPTGKKKWKGTRPDVDNMSKLLLDAMTQMGFWEDDSRIAELGMKKMYGTKDGIEVRIQRCDDNP